MNIHNLKPVEYYIQRNGVRLLGYGQAGCAKTPTIATAPRPVLLACEPGLASLKGSGVPTYFVNDADQADDFIKWITSSKEASNFDTVCIDSYTKLMEMYLERARNKYTNLQKAYGILEDDGRKTTNSLFWMEQKHLYIIGQIGKMSEDEGEILCPVFPGQALNRYIPHLFEQIGYFSRHNVPGCLKPVLGIRFQGTPGIRARDRSLRLAEVEWPDTPEGLPNLSRIFAKAMS